MYRFILIFILTFLTIFEELQAQSSLWSTKLAGDTIKNDPNDKWIKSTVNFYLTTPVKSTSTFKDAIKNYRERRIDIYAIQKIQDSLTNVQGMNSGSGIYLIFNNRHYLVTAKHIIQGINESSDLIELKELHMIQNAFYRKSFPANIYFPMHSALHPKQQYICSGLDADIAIIYLDTLLPEIRTVENFMDSVGYVPLKISDIATKPEIKIGDNIKIFGFPGVYDHDDSIPSPDYHYDFPYLSNPIVTFGQILRIEKNDKYFLTSVLLKSISVL